MIRAEERRRAEAAAHGKRRAHRRAGTVACVLALGLALFMSVSGCGALRAGRVLADALTPPPDLHHAVEETDVEVRRDEDVLGMTVYRPTDAEGPLPAVLVVHGAVERGARDSRMVALARSLAAHGATVAAPDLPALGVLRIDDEDRRRLADAALWLADRDDLAEDGRVAVLGISVGGSYGLLAAADPRLRDRVSAVLAFGAYDDLRALLLRWMTEPSPQPELFDPFTEGRRRVLLGNVARLVDPTDRAAVERELRALLRGGVSRDLLPDAAESARRVVSVARSTTAVDPDTAARLLAPLADELRALSPIPWTGPLPAPVYLLHGDADPVVPVASGRALAAALEAAEGSVSFFATGAFGHVTAGESPSLFELWPLLSFLGDFLEDAGL